MLPLKELLALPFAFNLILFILIGIIFSGWIPTGTVRFHDQNSKP